MFIWWGYCENVGKGSSTRWLCFLQTFISLFFSGESRLHVNFDNDFSIFFGKILGERFKKRTIERFSIDIKCVLVWKLNPLIIYVYVGIEMLRKLLNGDCYGRDLSNNFNSITICMEIVSLWFFSDIKKIDTKEYFFGVVLALFLEIKKKIV